MAYNNVDIIKACCSGGELVSYLYDEMSVNERLAFEDHLPNCGDCTDAFAELSLARLEVFEWNRDEFAAMPTPSFVIPYQNNQGFSWLKNWFEPVQFFPKIALGGALAASALAFVLFNAKPPENVQSISGLEIPEVSAPAIGPPLLPESKTVEQIAKVETQRPKDKMDPSRNLNSEPSTSGNTVAKARAIRNGRTPRNTREARNELKSLPVNAPRLTTFDDEDDRSLRLSDLIAEVSPNE